MRKRHLLAIGVLGFCGLLTPTPATASGDGAVALAFGALFVLFPFIAGIGAAWIKRLVLRATNSKCPTWTRALTVGFLEFCLGAAVLTAWWNEGLGVAWLGIYFSISIVLNLALCERWYFAPLLAAIPITLLLALLLFGPVGDGSPASRFADVLRHLN